MIILGMDIATSTGMCWMDTSLQPKDWRCLAVAAEGEFSEEKSGDLAVFLHAEMQACRPDFVAIEMPQRSVEQHSKKVRDPATGKITTERTINPNALQLTGLAAAAAAILDINNIPWGLVAVSSWRSGYYGKGFKPADWKQAAIDRAVLQGIQLPETLKAQRDAAEAVGIASSWMKCTQIAERHRQAFLDLRVMSPRRAA